MNEINLGSWLEAGEKLSDGWRETTWGEVLHERVERAWPGDELLSVTSARGVIRQSESAKRDTSSADKSNYRRVFVDDLVYNTMRMWQGVSSRSTFDGIVSPAYTVCIARIKQILPAYTAYLLKHPRSVIWFHRFAQGLVNDTLNLKYPTFARLPIILPPIEEQLAIVRVLDAATAAVNTARSRVVKLRRLQDGLLRDLLSRGLDEDGQLRDPKTQPESFRQSDLGLIPREWEEAALLSRVDIAEGQVDPTVSPYPDWVLIAPDHIESGTGRLILIQTAFQQGAISGKYVFSPGDILYSKIRPYLKKAIVATMEGLCSADMYPIRPGATLNSKMLLAILLGEKFSRFASAISARSGFPKINRKEMAEFQTAIPPKPEQERIAARLDEMETRVLAAQELLAKRETLLRALRDDLLTGGTRVSTELLALVQGHDFDDASDVATVEDAFEDEMEESEIEAFEVSA